MGQSQLFRNKLANPRASRQRVAMTAGIRRFTGLAMAAFAGQMISFRAEENGDVYILKAGLPKDKVAYRPKKKDLHLD